MRAMNKPCRSEAAADFESLRSHLFGVAYQILGRAADAEDVVQDVWVRWQRADRAQVRDRVAFLVTVTRRVALNVATSARARREVSAGRWLPDRDVAPVDPAQEAERAQDLEFAVHLLRERLPSGELAVFVLREAFDYPFRDIAALFDLSEANARQLARRARRRLAEQRHEPVNPVKRDGVLGAFLDATRAADTARLIDVLNERRRAAVRSGGGAPARSASPGGRPARGDQR